MYGVFDVVLYFVNPTVLVANKLTSYLILSYLPAGCVLLSPCSFRSLCFPESVGARMGSGPSQSVIWHVYCEYIIILYNLQGTIMSAK